MCPKRVGFRTVKLLHRWYLIVTTLSACEAEMNIVIGDLSDPKIVEFLDEHMKDMKSVSPPESTHVLDLDSLKKPGVTFWSVWEKEKLIGCGALKELGDSHGEIKSMRISARYRSKGVASELLEHILNEAVSRNYKRVSLETGSMVFFAPARRLYERFGFKYCAPFSEYKEDPNSVFMSLELADRA